MATKGRVGQRKSKTKVEPKSKSAWSLWHPSVSNWIMCLARPARRWAWDNRILAEMLWAVVLAAPPWFVGQFFQVGDFAASIQTNWPVIANALKKDVVLALVGAAVWIPALTLLRIYCSKILNDKPSGWDRSLSVLMSQFDTIVGHKENRISGYLVEAQKRQAAGDPPSASEIFLTITQPTAQLHRIIQGLWQVFNVLLQAKGDDETLKVNLVLVRDGVLQDFVCHCPAHHTIRSTIEQLRDGRSGIMRAANSGRIQVVESILDAGKKDDGGFLVTDEARSDEDGSLICFPVQLPDPAVVFVVSIYYGQRGTFERKYHHTYKKLLECFALRLKLEYSLLALKALSSVRGSENGT